MINIALYELEFINPLLRQIIKDVEGVFGDQTVTSLYRIDDPGVHGTLPLRGIDLRCHNDTMGWQIADFINDRWIYDPERPTLQVCIYHNTGRGWHLHFQVHQHTIRAPY